jgi:sugar O-acyltransferase (sialic acid O-acetyltransferase NeuD family)
MRGEQGGTLYLAGTGSFAVEVAEWARDGGWSVVGLIELLDDSRVGGTVAGLPVIAPEPAHAGAHTVIAMGGARHEHWALLASCGWGAATIVHPSAHVSPTAELASGCVVAPGAIIGAETAVGAHTLISRGALLGHHAHVGGFVSLMPGVNIGGNAQIGERAVVGMGAVIVNATQVGEDVTVAAGAVVVRDIPNGVRVQGVPARAYDG